MASKRLHVSKMIASQHALQPGAITPTMVNHICFNTKCI